MPVHVDARCRVRSRAVSRTRDESGAVAVEFALVLVPLVMILMGTVTAGVSYSHAIGLTNAVREGARFGATTQISATTPVPAADATTWANNVIARVRQTQFDDSANTASSSTSVCVQLYKQGPGPVANTTVCDNGGSNAPTLATSILTSPSADPSVPAGLTTGICVVRVVAARKFSISIGVANLPPGGGTLKRFSVARYERTGC